MNGVNYLIKIPPPEDREGVVPKLYSPVAAFIHMPFNLNGPGQEKTLLPTQSFLEPSGPRLARPGDRTPLAENPGVRNAPWETSTIKHFL